MATDERDLTICDDVKERSSWFFDGSGVSPQACRRLVIEAKKNDHVEFQKLDPTRLHRLDSVRVRRNGNGRDFDLTIETVGSLAQRSRLEISLTLSGHSDSHTIYDKIHGLTDSNTSLLLFLERATLDEILGSGWETQTWNLGATLTYSKDGRNRFWYDRIEETHRRSVIESTLRFDDLPSWEPASIEY